MRLFAGNKHSDIEGKRSVRYRAISGNNRKRTPGRVFYYQTIKEKSGRIKTIKHMQNEVF